MRFGVIFRTNDTHFKLITHEIAPIGAILQFCPFIYIPRGLEQVWECISLLHSYCNYLGMIKAQFLIGQHFLGFDMLKKN